MNVEGYYDNFCCGMTFAGSCGESTCPDLCLFLEGCLCNSCAISSSRSFVMEKYDLSSDPCDYRLIRINNCLQMLACICHVLAIINDAFDNLAQLIDRIADIFYHTITGCMTAQVSTPKHQISTPVIECCCRLLTK